MLARIVLLKESLHHNSDSDKEWFVPKYTLQESSHQVPRGKIDEVPPNMWRKFYETLSPKESKILTDRITEVEPGLKNDVHLTCKNVDCEREFDDRVPINANFFRVAGK